MWSYSHYYYSNIELLIAIVVEKNVYGCLLVDANDYSRVEESS